MATIRQHGNNWQAIIRKSGYKPKVRTFRTKKMAQDWARSVEDQMTQGTYHEASNVVSTLSVSELLQRYGQEITPRKKSAIKEQSRIRILSDYFKHDHVSKLTAQAIIAFVDKRRETVTADTIMKDLNTLSHAIDTGIALWGLKLPSNPVKTAKATLSVTKTLVLEEARERRVSPVEEKLIFAEAQHYGGEILNIIKVAISTAMRRREISKIKAVHINEKGSTLYIPDTKTGGSRKIPISPDIMKLLVDIKMQLEGDGYLFKMREGSISQAFRRIVRKLKIENLRFHDLRHEATSRLFEAGWQIHEVKAVTGHKDLSSLMRYTHLRPEELAKKFK